jgi:hypothetical protein
MKRAGRFFSIGLAWWAAHIASLARLGVMRVSVVTAAWRPGSAGAREAIAPRHFGQLGRDRLSCHPAFSSSFFNVALGTFSYNFIRDTRFDVVPGRATTQAAGAMTALDACTRSGHDDSAARARERLSGVWWTLVRG